MTSTVRPWLRGLAVGLVIALVFVVYPAAWAWYFADVVAPEWEGRAWIPLAIVAAGTIACVAFTIWLWRADAPRGRAWRVYAFFAEMGVPRRVWCLIVVWVLIPDYSVLDARLVVVDDAMWSALIGGWWVWAGTQPGSTHELSLRDEWGAKRFLARMTRRDAIIVVALLVPASTLDLLVPPVGQLLICAAGLYGGYVWAWRYPRERLAAIR